jgi:hypothetical protein
MPADNSRHVIAAARQRSQATHRRAVEALRRMDNQGLPITYQALAREADVSRSWLYAQPDLRTEIDRLRQRERPTEARLVPDRQRPSNASLQTRLDLAGQRIKNLESDNQRLRLALAHALADRRGRPER